MYVSSPEENQDDTESFIDLISDIGMAYKT